MHGSWRVKVFLHKRRSKRLEYPLLCIAVFLCTIKSAVQILQLGHVLLKVHIEQL